MKQLYQFSTTNTYNNFSNLLYHVDVHDQKQVMDYNDILNQIQNDIIKNQVINNLSNYTKQFESQKQEIVQLQRQIAKTTKEVADKYNKFMKVYDEKINCLNNIQKKVNYELDLFGFQINYLVAVQEQDRQVRQYGKLVLDFWETIQEFEIQRLDIIKEVNHTYYFRVSIISTVSLKTLLKRTKALVM